MALDGQRNIIPLDSPLDINSNDMLVPLSKPTYEFNRQKYLGSLLQTSVRYEADGWFAGWWGHTFELVNDRQDRITPPLNDNEFFAVNPRDAAQGYKYYIIQHKDLGLRYTYVPTTWSQWLIGQGEIERYADSTGQGISITGTTSLGDPFEITVDPYTGALITASFPNDTQGILYAVTELNGLVYKLTVDRRQVAGGEYVRIRYNKPLVLVEQEIRYSYNNLKHTWGVSGTPVEFIYDENSASLMSIGSEFSIVNGSVTVERPNTADEYIKATIKDETLAIIDSSFEFIEKWTSDIFTSFEAGTTYVNSSSIEEPCNKQEGQIVVQKTVEFDITNAAIGRYMLPVWMSHAVQGMYKIEFHPVADPVARTTYFDIYLPLPDGDSETEGGAIHLTKADLDVTFKCFLSDPNNPRPVLTWNDGRITLNYIGGALFNDTAPTEADKRYIWRIAYPDMPRYTECRVQFRNASLVGSDFQPYDVRINPNYNPPATIYDGVGTVPYGCIINPAYSPNPLKNNNKYNSANPQDDPDTLPNDLQDMALYLKNETITDTIDNVDYNTDVTSADYDPRPVVPAVDAQPWVDVSRINTTRNTNQTINVTTPNNYGPRYFIDTGLIVSGDWPDEDVTYWAQYYPRYTEKPIHSANGDRRVNDGTRYGAILENDDGTPIRNITPVLQTSPDSNAKDSTDANAAYTNAPKFATGQPAPPEEPPYQADLLVDLRVLSSSLHTLVNDLVERKDVRWQWAIQGTKSIHVYGWYWFAFWLGSRGVWNNWYTYYWNNKSNYSGNSGSQAVLESLWEDLPYQFEIDQGLTTSRVFRRRVEDRVDAGAGKIYEGEHQYNNDSWTLHLRCINQNGDYPIPVGSPYFTMRFTCNGNFRNNTNLMALSTSRSISIPSYNGAGYDGNYTVLNTIYMHDPALFTWTADDNVFAGRATFIVPLCVRAYSYVMVETPNIISTDKNAFTMRTVPNILSRFDPNNPNGLELDVRCWRFDDAGYSNNAALPQGVEYYRLNLAMPTYENVSGVSTASKKLLLIYNTTGRAPLYMLKQACVVKDTTTGAITGYTNYAYPRWITAGPARRYDGTDQVTPYMPSQDSVTFLNVLVTLRVYKYIQNCTQGVSRDPQTLYNQTLFDSIIPNFTIGLPRADPLTQTLRLALDVTGVNYTDFIYDVVEGRFYVSGASLDNPDDLSASGNSYASWDLNSIEFKRPQGLNQVDNEIIIRVKTLETFELNFYKTFILERTPLTDNMALVQQDGNILTFNTGFGYADLSIDTLVDATEVSFIIGEDDGIITTLYVGINNSAIAYYTPEGIIQRNSDLITYNDTIERSDQYEVTIDYDGNAHTIIIDKREASKNTLRYVCTDIRDGSIKEAYRRDLADIYMFIKQFWSNDVSVENYWWLDNQHVLELNKYDIVLRKKVTGKVDDWNGDMWEDLVTVPRSTFIETVDLFYTVSYALNTRPYFFKLRNVQNKYIEVLYADLLDPSFNFVQPQWQVARIPVAYIKLGQPVTTDSLCSYIQLDIDTIIGASKITSTRVGNTFMIGFQLARGLQQWTVKVVNSNVSIVTGYGCVGLDGSLTGGQIPEYCCTASGFTGTVRPLSDLPAEVNSITIPEYIVGTESTVWFVKQNIPQIVSHLTFNGTTHNKEILELNNNIAERYESTSFGADGIFDVLPFTFNISQLFTNNPVINTISAIVTPSIWALNPKYTMMALISHSVGQFAYVWRNSTQPQIDHLKTDADITFATYKEKNVTFARGGLATNIFLQVVIKAIGNVVDRAADAAVNIAKGQGVAASVKQSATGFSQFALDNLVTTAADGITTTGFIISMKSQLKRIRTLSMFYSISDKSECWAGPGFVNHNMQGQCLAQSITDKQVEGKRVAFWALFGELSIAIEKQKQRGYIFLAEELRAWISGVGSVTAGSSPGPIIPMGPIVAGVAQAALLALEGLITLSMMATDVIPALCACIGGYPEGVPYLHGMLSKRDLFMEGTHLYGNKSMSFFWPAFGVTAPNEYTNESVSAEYDISSQRIELGGGQKWLGGELWSDYAFRTLAGYNDNLSDRFNGNLDCVNIYCQGHSKPAKAPVDMAVVEGTTTFLPNTKFRNEQIGVAQSVFTHPPLHDYCINKQWSLGVNAIAGDIISVSCDDTKLMDGPPSNIVITQDFCGIASSYIALEIKNVFDYRYLRPWTVTPNAIALNINRINCVHDAKAYHAFDGQGNRIVKWTGGAGMDKELQFQQYLYQINDHFKRSSIFPPSQFFGNFQSPPSVAIRSYELVANEVQEVTSGKGTTHNTPGELRTATRYSLPVHSEPLSTLPAVNRMLAPYKLNVVEGVTSLTTPLRNTQTKYKAPSSVDFAINGLTYRATEEFICVVAAGTGFAEGQVAIQDTVASAGLTYLGATTKEAFFYSPATKLYYSFAGDKEIFKRDITNRFDSLDKGRWDFINQEVMLRAQLRDGENMVLRLDQGQFKGEVWPPNETIYNERSGFKLFSVAGGLVFQGPKRFIVSRFIALDHMIPQIVSNKKRWKKVAREEFNYNRDYGWQYEDFDTETPISAVYGWTHNPFLLSSSMLGVDEETDAKFEWTLTFAWTEQMEKIYMDKEYVTVNIMAETVAQGGTVSCRPTHLYLFKECFTREGNAGYYTFKFQSNNGIGNRERIFIWSDGFIAAEDVTIDCKNVTTNRTQPLHTQVDVKDLIEL